MKNLHLFLIALILLACSPAAHAADGVLTEESIKAYYAEAAKVYALDYPSYVAYLEKNLHDSYEGTVTSTFNIPNQPQARSIDRLSKQDLLETSRQDHAAMHGVTLINEVKTVEIAADGKTAYVTDQTTIKDMPLPPPPGLAADKSLRVSGSGPCKEVVVLSDAGVMQALKSDCEFTMTITEEQGL